MKTGTVVVLSETKNINELAKKTFYLDGFRIDPLKGVIEVAEEVHQIEPKVMDVLLYLILDLGDVVEQEILFSQVWPKSIYSPGSIRRCITILRKIFKDDNKTLIVTHPKRGYSLQGKIHFPDKLLDQAVKTRKKRTTVLAITTMILLSCITIALLGTKQAPQNIHVVTASPLTASELHEDGARFSPDGQYIAFIKSIQGNEHLGHIWLMNLESEQEYQLTKEATYLKSLVWMQDGKALLYVSVAQKGISINRITLNMQTQVSSIIEVLNLPKLTWISSIAWAKSNQLFYIAKHKGKYSLIRSNLTNGEQSILFSEDDSFHPYEIALSKDSQQLAIFALNQKYNSTVKLMAVNKLTTQDIKETKEIVLGQNKYYGAWHPNNQSLVIHDGRELLSLNMQGDMKKIAFENYQYLRYPEFSPDGKQILLTRQVLDEDIWLTPSDNKALSTKVINSNTTDFLASLSPDGKKIAFVSIQRGFPQLFVHDIESAEQTLLYDNPKQLLFIAYPVWHQSSTKIASALNQRPFVIEFADNAHTIKELTYSKGIPLQWYFNEESLLMKNYDQGNKAYAKLSLLNQATTTLLSSIEHHAQLSNDNELLIISNTEIIQANFNGKQPVPLATVNGEIIDHYPTSKGIYLSIKNQDTLSLWLYDFSSKKINKMSELSNDLKIWDVEKNNNFMLTISRRSEKDLLLLTLKYGD
ncbi:transcriptional regulator, CadC [Colwellia psychrerythraea]|uniref:Transcriptional regulator, CadC n=1 Tax=Colwellia psychrerythraea TaxID=28229 RepID=A0A099KP70_COLPS|nr:transcriptional regulator, CadC [Colwellia psychrerythraea]